MEFALVIIVFILICIGLAIALYKKNNLCNNLKNRLQNPYTQNQGTDFVITPNELEMFFSVSLDMLCIADTDGYFRLLNPEWENTLGYPLDDLVGHQYIEFIHPEDIEATIDKTKHLADKKVIINFENRYRHKDGSYRWLEWRSYPVGKLIYAAARDITPHKIVLEELSRSDLWLRESQKNSHIGSYNLNIAEGLWKSSAELDVIFGIPADYPKNVEGWSNLIHPEHSQEILDYLLHHVITERNPFDREYRIIRQNDGEVRWVHGLGNLYCDASGNPASMIGTIQDITEKKIAEQEIKKLNEELERKVEERTNKLHQLNIELESFAYSVSHDLRAPLRHVDGFLKLLYSNIPSPSETVKNYYEKIDVASKRMSVLIDELLKFSRLGRKELNFISVDLNSLMNEIIEQAKPDIAQRKIDWNIQPLPIVPADKNLLKIAFENLISNAIKYTAKKEEAKIEIGSYEESADQIVIFIKDNGVGFDMAYSDKLFGVFQRLHSSDEFDGMGIGLANAKQIIFKHKGSIRAKGILNQGAIFYITLPK